VDHLVAVRPIDAPNRFGENNLLTFYIIYTILARFLLGFFEKKLKKLCFSKGNWQKQGTI
jgi:hypothetical protein